MDKDIITDFGNLYRAYRKAKRGKSHNASATRFSSMALDGINQLRQQLIDQTYTAGPYNEFTIYEPKERVIKSCPFKDKVVQHCFTDNILHPRLAGVFITDNYAGQIGKGTLFGMDRLKQHMLDFYREHGTDGWILKCDIKKFFYSIDHEILKDILDYYFPDEYSKWLNRIYVDSTESPGLPLGNQVTQVYALLMLHGIDVYVTREMGIQYYGRYMDDFFLIHHDKAYLEECLGGIRTLADSLGLELNGKTQIMPFRKGLSFTGFQHYVTTDGKYIRKLKGENKRKAKRRVRKTVQLVRDGKLSEEKFWEKYNAWKNHALHGNCIKLCHSMDLYVKGLMGTNDENNG